jgi:hypothetical protein
MLSSRSQAACVSNGDLLPPPGSAATPPNRKNRCIHRTADPNRSASCCDAPASTRSNIQNSIASKNRCSVCAGPPHFRQRQNAGDRQPDHCWPRARYRQSYVEKKHSPAGAKTMKCIENVRLGRSTLDTGEHSGIPRFYFRCRCGARHWGDRITTRHLVQLCVTLQILPLLAVGVAGLETPKSTMNISEPRKRMSIGLLKPLDGFKPKNSLQDRALCWSAQDGDVRSRNFSTLQSAKHFHVYHATNCKKPWALHFSLVNSAASDAIVSSVKAGYSNCCANLVWLQTIENPVVA